MKASGTFLQPVGTHGDDPFGPPRPTAPTPPMSKCIYCGYSNDASQRHCGEGTTHGCGAPLDIAEETGWGVFAPLGNLVGMMDGEYIYDDNPALYYIRSCPEFMSVLEI